MRILMVGVGPKRVGGMWTVANEYISSQFFNSEVKLTYVATSTNGSIAKRVVYMLVGYLKILWILLFYNIDIVHIHMAEKGSTFRKGRVARWGRLFGKKVIIHLHAGPFMVWYNTLPKKRKKKVQINFSYADRVLVLGEYWKRELGAIVPENKMIVLYNGIDVPAKNHFNSKGTNIIYFGVMNKAKGIYDLLKAIKCIDQELNDQVKVLLCGNDLVGNVQMKINQYGLQDRVQMMGWVDKETRLKIFQNAAVDVLPSYYEGLSMTVLEAMAYGIPVVTTRISTMPELLGKNRIMLDAGDYKALGTSILALVNDKNKRIEISNDEYSRAEKYFSNNIFIHNTLEIYSQLIEKDKENR